MRRRLEGKDLGQLMLFVLLGGVLFTSCRTNLNSLRDGNPDVSPEVIRAAGASSDPDLDGPLNAILERRADGGVTVVAEQVVTEAIRAQTRRGSTSATPSIEKLVFDPSPDIQIQSLAALEILGNPESLNAVVKAARTASRIETVEQAYHTFTVLTGVPVNILDEARLMSVRNRILGTPDSEKNEPEHPAPSGG